VSLTNPTPDSVDVSLNASIKLPPGMSADLKAITLNLYSNESDSKHPYLQIHLPRYHLSGTKSLSVVNQTAPILDEDQFRGFLSQVVNSENFTLSASGSTKAYLGAAKAPIKANIKVKKDEKLLGRKRAPNF
jgi:Protein of unknown function (DUF3712)